MLNIVSTKPCSRSKLELDPYVPLEIELEGAVEGEARLYWRAREGAESLVEVGVRPADGRVQSVTVTSLAPGRVSQTQPDLDETEQVDTAPCVDLAMWPSPSGEFRDRFVDESCPVACTLGSESVVVWFTAERGVERWLSVGDARFGMSGQSLVCVQARGLTPEQLAEVRASLLAE